MSAGRLPGRRYILSATLDATPGLASAGIEVLDRAVPARRECKHGFFHLPQARQR